MLIFDFMVKSMNKIARILEDCLNMKVSSEEISALSKSEKRDFLRYAERLQCDVILKALERIDAPKDLIVSMKKLIRSNVRRNMIILEELKKLFATLMKEKINFVVLKGFSLGKKRIYSHMHDIDLLVHKKDIEKCEEAAFKNGFSISKDKNKKYWLLKGYHTKYEKETAGEKIEIEFHWDTEKKYAPFHLNIKKLLANREKLKCFGIMFYSLKREELLLHLALHATYHHSMINPTKDIFLLHQEINKGGINWGKMILISEKTGSTAFLYEALLLSQKKFFSEIPKEVMERLRTKSNKLQLFLLKIFEHQFFDYLDIKEIKIRRFLFWNLFKFIKSR